VTTIAPAASGIPSHTSSSPVVRRRTALGGRAACALGQHVGVTFGTCSEYGASLATSFRLSASFTIEKEASKLSCFELASRESWLRFSKVGRLEVITSTLAKQD
jgi:hypothetical protein